MEKLLEKLQGQAAAMRDTVHEIRVAVNEMDPEEENDWLCQMLDALDDLDTELEFAADGSLQAQP